MYYLLKVGIYFNDKINKNFLLGLGLVASFVLFSSAKDVYVGHIVQTISPLALVFACFAFTVLVFNAGYLLSNNNIIQSLKDNKFDVFMLNITTLFSWVGQFVSLKFLEPSISTSITTGISPVLTVFLSAYLYKKEIVTKTEKLCSVALLLSMGYLLTISMLGHSSLGHIGVRNIIIGFLACLICGFSIAGNTVYSKRLTHNSASFVMSTRFYLLLLVSLGYMFLNKDEFSLLLTNWKYILLLAGIGVALPLFLLQKGIERISPVSVSFVVILGSTSTFALQYFDPRFTVNSIYSLIGILSIVLIVFLGFYSQKRNLK